MDPVCLPQTSSLKADIQTYSLRTERLGDCASLQNRKWSIFFSKVYPQGTHIAAVWKEKKKRGLWVKWLCCSLKGTPGQSNSVIHFEEASWEDQNRKNRQSRNFGAQNPAFNQSSDTMETWAVTETRWTTRDTKRKRKQTTDCWHEIQLCGLPSDNHPFLLFAHFLALFLQPHDKHT